MNFIAVIHEIYDDTKSQFAVFTATHPCMLKMYLSAIYAVNFAVRAPLIYGGFKPGEWQGIAEYIRNRVPAFVLLLGHVDEVIVATGLGALAFGLPIITDLEVPQLGKIDTTLFEALVTEKDYKKLPSKCLLTRGIKVKMAEVAVPVPYAAAFEGERVRKEQQKGRIWRGHWHCRRRHGFKDV